MRFGSLFAGIGGIDLGLERAGMECAWQVENDEWCNRVLAKHWPDVPRFGDIRTLNVSALEPVDLVAGGFPCQPVSLAGKQQAQADERWLWPEFARVLRALRPTYAILENVPGLLTANEGRAAQEVFGDLAEHGYDAEWASIPAAAVGAPHLRYRVFIVAHRADAERQRLEVPPQRDGRTEQGIEAGAFWDYLDRLRDDVADAERGRRDGWPRYLTEAPRREEPADGGWWTTEPNVGRVANGVPRRVDRLRGLGNAVVPQVAEWVGRQIMEAV